MSASLVTLRSLVASSRFASGTICGIRPSSTRLQYDSSIGKLSPSCQPKDSASPSNARKTSWSSENCETKATSIWRASLRSRSICSMGDELEPNPSLEGPWSLMSSVLTPCRYFSHKKLRAEREGAGSSAQDLAPSYRDRSLTPLLFFPPTPPFGPFSVRQALLIGQPLGLLRVAVTVVVVDLLLVSVLGHALGVELG